MICREFIALLHVYLEREAPEDRLHLYEEHLIVCASCRAYLASYRTTIVLSREAFEDGD